MKDLPHREIELDISVDENALDREWVGQPRLFFRYAAKLADARRDSEQAKTEVELVKAELELAIRSSPEKFELAKITEAAVTATVLSQGEYGRVRQASLDAKHTVDVLEAAVTALEHRKRALEGLVQLRLANYYSSPKAPEGAKEDMAEMEKRLVRNRGQRRGDTDD